MNIAIDIRVLMESRPTGIGEYTFNLLNHIFEIDNKNSYYLFYNSWKKSDSGIPVFKKENVHYCPFRTFNKLLNFSLFAFKKPRLDKWMEKKYKVKIDLFFFPNISFISTACPYIITAHDLSFKFFPEFLCWKRKIWHSIINPEKLFRNARRVISVSYNTTHDLINQCLLPPQKISTTFAGVGTNYKLIDNDHEKFKKIKSKYKLPPKFFLFLGTIEPRKNIESLIAAFEKFQRQNSRNNEYHLIIAGKLGWKYRQILRKIKGTGKIIFTHFIEDSEKRYFYNLASCFIYPSYYEGFGFPPLEAMACGCPVITSHISSLSEICEDAAILIDPNNVNDITESMNEIINPKTAAYYRQKGLQQVKKFSWYKTAEELLKIFKEIG